MFKNLNIKEPKHYIKTKWENRDGFKYKQPVDYCNDVRLNFETLNNFQNIFGVNFSDVKKESHAFNSALDESKYYSELWANKNARDKAFNKIYEFNLSGKSGSGSSTTPLMPFEIFMMNDGFEIISFCELNAIDPSLSLIIDKSTKRIFKNFTTYRGITFFKRFYKKNKKTISLGFGHGKTNFYFTINGIDNYQLDNDINNYDKAINGRLKTLL